MNVFVTKDTKKHHQENVSNVKKHVKNATLWNLIHVLHVLMARSYLLENVFVMKDIT